MMKNNKSKQNFEKAKNIIPGGVNSPVRAFGSVDMEYPIFAQKGKGSKIIDADGNEYIDYIMSWGPLILGHCDENILNEIKKSIENGWTFGLSTEKEIEIAEIIIKSIKSIEKVRLTTSGTEAVMTAIRLARAYTGKKKLIKFEGCYHGHSDSVLVKAGSGALTYNSVDSNGIIEDTLKNTIILEYNNEEMIHEFFKNYNNDVAALIIEPIAANMGLIVPDKSFLKLLREYTEKNGIVLIFDEVISGFRVGFGGAQEYFGIDSDLTVLGKIIGGGFPVGAVGGKKEIMNLLSPNGNVYHAGTLSGNPISVTAGINTILKLRNNINIYSDLRKKTEFMKIELEKIINELKIPVTINSFESLLTIFFYKEKISNYKNAIKSDTKMYARFFKKMLENNILLPPSQFEALFISASHSNQDILKTLEIIKKVLVDLYEKNAEY